ncbi:hypothetical protein GDO81_021930 [Engystomops pustulosus]|uniref:Uncharacterized protein n=1 Tax=Engystomops pustulosus TaxID=76066 RepID=A0AAV6ZU93_ENGPU|nr:hypothetical protein GDO81_021930 [Engystomops pustulosus]
MEMLIVGMSIKQSVRQGMGAMYTVTWLETFLIDIFGRFLTHGMGVPHTAYSFILERHVPLSPKKCLFPLLVRKSIVHRWFLEPLLFRCGNFWLILSSP